MCGRRTVALVVALLGALLAAGVARAQPIVDIRDGGFNHAFGTALAELGGDLLVTTRNSSYYGDGHLVDETTGAFIRTFANPNTSIYDFGYSAATVGGNALFGAVGRGAGAGAALLFDAGTGALIRTFSNPGDPNARFGWAVAALGTNVLVGSPHPSLSGAVYLFDGATGALLRTFQAPTPTNDDFFGSSLAVLGGKRPRRCARHQRERRRRVPVRRCDRCPDADLLQSEPGGCRCLRRCDRGCGRRRARGRSVARRNGVNIGIAHLFDPATGGLIRSFSPPTAADYQHFGGSFAIFGGHVLIAAQKATFGGDSSDPLAYVFDVATGALERTLWNPSPVYYDYRYGSAVAVVDGKLVVSNPRRAIRIAVRCNVFCGGATGCAACETCGPGGACIVAPHPTCHARISGRTPLRIVNRVTSDDRDLVSWRTGGEFTGTLGFSAPTEAEPGNDYTLCLYDESGGPPTLLFDAVAPAGGTCGTGPCWKPTPNCSGATCGYTYNDKDSTPDGFGSCPRCAALPARPHERCSSSGRAERISPAGRTACPRCRCRCRSDCRFRSAEAAAGRSNTPSRARTRRKCSRRTSGPSRAEVLHPHAIS
jgi:hypothetical protein